MTWKKKKETRKNPWRGGLVRKKLSAYEEDAGEKRKRLALSSGTSKKEKKGGGAWDPINGCRVRKSEERCIDSKTTLWDFPCKEGSAHRKGHAGVGKAAKRSKVRGCTIKKLSQKQKKESRHAQDADSRKKHH